MTDLKLLLYAVQKVNSTCVELDCDCTLMFQLKVKVINRFQPQQVCSGLSSMSDRKCTQLYCRLLSFHAQH